MKLSELNDEPDSIPPLEYGEVVRIKDLSQSSKYFGMQGKIIEILSSSTVKVKFDEMRKAVTMFKDTLERI